VNTTIAGLRARLRALSGGRGDRGSMMVELAGFLLPAIVVVMAISIGALNLSVSRMDLDFTSAAAARAASLQRTPAAAATAARNAATADLASRAITCAELKVDPDFSQWRRGGSVTVTIHCTVRMGALTGFGGVPGSFTASASTTVPLDTYRKIGT
jgi:hypothetical protein